MKLLWNSLNQTLPSQAADQIAWARNSGSSPVLPRIISLRRADCPPNLMFCIASKYKYLSSLLSWIFSWALCNVRPELWLGSVHKRCLILGGEGGLKLSQKIGLKKVKIGLRTSFMHDPLQRIDFSKSNLFCWKKEFLL